MAALGVMGAVAGGLFDPDAVVTRGDAAAALAGLWRAAGRLCPKGSAGFLDVAAGEAGDVDCLHALGVVLGTSAGLFSPGAVLSRAEAAVMLTRLWEALGGTCPAARAGFADVGSAHFASAGVDCLFALGVARGAASELFDPEAALTRAETAALNARWLRAHAAGTDTATALTVTVEGSRIVLGWAPVPGAVRYRVQYRAGYHGAWTEWPHAGTATAAAIDGLAEGGAHQVRVGAVTAAGDTRWSSAVTAAVYRAPALPAAPAVTAGNTQLTVRWSPPPGAAVTGYEAQYLPPGSPDWYQADPLQQTTTATTAIIGSLQNGTTYPIRVRALTENGPTRWSNTAHGTPTDTPGTPGAPGGPGDGLPGAPVIQTAQHLDGRDLYISWTHPDNGGTPITGYNVQYRYGGTPAWIDVDHTGTDRSIRIYGLGPPTTYQVRVRAVNPKGESPWSAPAYSHPGGDNDRWDQLPRNLTATPADTRISVTWKPPTGTNGNPITGYTIIWKPINSSGRLVDLPATTSYTITGLTPATAYQISVRARYTGSGHGPLAYTYATTTGTSTTPPDSTPPTSTLPQRFPPQGTPQPRISSQYWSGGPSGVGDYRIVVEWDRLPSNPHEQKYYIDVDFGYGKIFYHLAMSQEALIIACPNTSIIIYIRAHNGVGSSRTGSLRHTVPPPPAGKTPDPSCLD